MKAYLFSICYLICAQVYSQSQISEDSYTRYELLDPSSHSFRILYDVTATKAPNGFYYNTLRKGSDHKVDAALDMMTGLPLTWTIVNGKEAKISGLEEADTETDYLKIKLERKVFPGTEYRLRIDKTYGDEKSYYTNGDVITFTRPLSIRKNAIVLPAGYELIGCNYPSQVMTEPDGKIKISFMNIGIGEVILKVTARKLKTPFVLSKPLVSKPSQNTTPGPDRSKARINYVIPERATQTREIVYFLQQPETNSFRLYHDYTETREGIDKYINIVRPGSKASNPSAKNLDNGKELKVETLRGTEITNRKIEIGEPVTSETEIVVIWFDAVKKGQSTRIRIEETYTDPNRYLLHNGELIFDRSFGRPYNTVILPDGYALVGNSIPAVISQTGDGKIKLDFENNRPDEVDVFMKGVRR